MAHKCWILVAVLICIYTSTDTIFAAPGHATDCTSSAVQVDAASHTEALKGFAAKIEADSLKLSERLKNPRSMDNADGTVTLLSF